MFTGVHHLAFIAQDLDATIRFWRDLLGLPLSVTTGSAGFKHYFFRVSDADAVAFFWWPGATAMAPKAPGLPTSDPRGFDHVAIGVSSKADLYALRDRIVAAGFEVAGPVDHGLALSIYFTDPNGLSVEFTWQRAEVLAPLHLDAEPLDAAREGSAPQPGRWPSTPPAGLPEVTRVAEAEVALFTQAGARGLLRFIDEQPSDPPTHAARAGRTR
jgi:catechol 2,3-dioxygenase-like lactoylglutathione lyase family enzyme